VRKRKFCSCVIGEKEIPQPIVANLDDEVLWVISDNLAPMMIPLSKIKKVIINKKEDTLEIIMK